MVKQDDKMDILSKIEYVVSDVEWGTDGQKCM